MCPYSPSTKCNIFANIIIINNIIILTISPLHIDLKENITVCIFLNKFFHTKTNVWILNHCGSKDHYSYMDSYSWVKVNGNCALCVGLTLAPISRPARWSAEPPHQRGTLFNPVSDWILALSFPIGCGMPNVPGDSWSDEPWLSSSSKWPYGALSLRSLLTTQLHLFLSKWGRIWWCHDNAAEQHDLTYRDHAGPLITACMYETSLLLIQMFMRNPWCNS